MAPSGKVNDPSLSRSIFVPDHHQPTFRPYPHHAVAPLQRVETGASLNIGTGDSKNPYLSSPSVSSSSPFSWPRVESIHSGIPHHQSAQNVPESKLTPSCSRCRAKKLRCHYERGTGPCTNCITKGLGEECHRDLRIPRGRKRQRDDGRADTSKNSRKAEMAKLRRKLAELEALENQTSESVSPERIVMRSSDAHKGESPYERSSFADPTKTPQKGDVISSSLKQSKSEVPKSHKHAKERSSGQHDPKVATDAEDAALILESFAFANRHPSSARFSAKAAAVPGSSDSTIEKLTIADDIKHSFWASPSNLAAHLEVVREAKQDPYMCDPAIVEELISVYLYRVNHNIGHVVHGTGFKRASDAFLRMSEEEIVTSSLFVDPCSLALWLFALCLGFEFHPVRLPPGRSDNPGFRAVEALRKKSIDPTRKWYELAKRCLKVDEGYELPSLAALQAACLQLFRGKESPSYNRMLLSVAITSAQDFGLHRLGDAERKPWMNDAAFIRLETGVRIWNYLSVKDWCSAGAHGLTFMIQPSQTTTRKPLHCNDSDVEGGQCRLRSREEWVEMSYVLAQLELAECIRESVELRNLQAVESKESNRSKSDDETPRIDSMPARQRQEKVAAVGSLAGLSPAYNKRVQAKIEAFIAHLPSFFQIDSEARGLGVIAVQRWLLHQQIFDLLLKLNRSQLSTAMGRASCLSLVDHILSQHSKIRSICPVIDHFSITSSHIYSASIIVLLDLLSRPNGTTEAARKAWRDKISNAMEGLRNAGWMVAGVRVLEVMLMQEEERWKTSRAASSRCEKGKNVFRKEESLAEVARSLVEEVGGGGLKPVSGHPILKSGKMLGHSWSATSTNLSRAQTDSGNHEGRQQTAQGLSPRQKALEQDTDSRWWVPDSQVMPALGAFPHGQRLPERGGRGRSNVETTSSLSCQSSEAESREESHATATELRLSPSITNESSFCTDSRRTSVAVSGDEGGKSKQLGIAMEKDPATSNDECRAQTHRSKEVLNDASVFDWALSLGIDGFSGVNQVIGSNNLDPFLENFLGRSSSATVATVAKATSPMMAMATSSPPLPSLSAPQPPTSYVYPRHTSSPIHLTGVASSSGGKIP